MYVCSVNPRMKYMYMYIRTCIRTYCTYMWRTYVRTYMCTCTCTCTCIYTIYTCTVYTCTCYFQSSYTLCLSCPYSAMHIICIICTCTYILYTYIYILYIYVHTYVRTCVRAYTYFDGLVIGVEVFVNLSESSLHIPQ